MTERRLVLIGGTAGVGKTGVARRLAGELGAGWLQLDTLWLALTDALAPGSDARRLLDIDDRLRHGHETAEVLVDRHIAASGTICAALRRPLEFELQAHESVVADGAWLLPEFAGSLDIPGATVSSVFLHEPDLEHLREAMSSRRSVPMAAPWHDRSTRLAWLYGNWLAAGASGLGLPVLSSRPWGTLDARVRDSIA